MAIRVSASEQHKKHKERKRNERVRLFANACRALKRAPIDVDHLSLESQVQLLQEYINRLDTDLAEFTALYSDDSGRSAAVIIKRERYRALDALARLKVGISRGDQPMRVR